ncbi:Trehalase [Flaviramulus basaltis]|uniref:Trehalase n=1 Tax=Flaviramulus basaltis TaxID=369401 RepID=A0A1K2IFF6_9FLAO|nr:trehalase family glycosidase [Flaviramulus basaltis]SFZ90986.1 Trehalase [Flaviramulus basaltis]
MKIILRIKHYATLLILLVSFSTFSQEKEVPETTVIFNSTDTSLKKLYDRAEKLAQQNIVYYGDRNVLIEGAEYTSVWLETQPMGGYMYAKRNLEIAKNNINIFIDNQRDDGRLPGVIYKKNEKTNPNYAQFQGLYFAMPAFEMYYLLNKDLIYLNRVYNALEKFDNYLWKTRDSDNNACLETWCVYDNGEDGSVRFNDFPKAWSFDFPPSKEAASKLSKEALKLHCKEDFYDNTIEMTVPIESMDVMSYSYSCRDVLALISKELNNGKAQFWRKKANKVQAKIKSYLWDNDKLACYDKDKNNETMPVLLHNNLRCMYLGSFDEQMANDFIRHHLMNPDEFWTPMPLPSIAANDPSFKNISGNNWSGQPQGLTYQRSIRALENYDHYAELTLIGQKFINVLKDSQKFTQQFDPFKATTNNSKDGYGPTILATLEFISRFYGVHITQDKIYWSCLDDNFEYDYTQKWNGFDYKLQTKGDTVFCSINGELIFSFSKGARVVTNLVGELIEVVGIDVEEKSFQYKKDNKYFFLLKPNSIYKMKNDKAFEESSSVGFYHN